MMDASQRAPTKYDDWLSARRDVAAAAALAVDTSSELNANLFPFQEALIRRALASARYAIFADCGLGKTLIELAWCQSLIESKDLRALVICPLAVAPQIVREGEKFGIEVTIAGGSGTESLPEGCQKPFTRSS
jgi:superfamily II DNA or RNA helicase